MWNEYVTRVMQMVNSVNAFEVMVESVPDSQAAKCSVLTHSPSVISSFLNLG